MESILVVEDDSDALEVLCLVLSEAGYVVEGAQSGAGAYRILNERRFDLVITDIFLMEDRDGFELVSAVQAQTPKTPIIVISGRAFIGTVDVLSIAARLGATATLTKPFSNEKLLETVRRAFEGRSDAEAAVA